MRNPRLMLTEEQRALIGAVRDVARDKDFRANSIKYLDGTFPWDNLKALAQIGVLGMSIPEEYGGSDLGVFDTALVLEEVAKTCYTTAMGVMSQLGVQARVIARYATSTCAARSCRRWPRARC
jgi:alkylation response protein AidB-like acyl-CoA dehydrogenase